MKKLFLILCLAAGLVTFSRAGDTGSKAVKEAVFTCTLTVTCADGSTVNATASSCEKAGKMVDAGCS